MCVDQGWTALHIAAAQGHASAVDCLLGSQLFAIDDKDEIRLKSGCMAYGSQLWQTALQHCDSMMLLAPVLALTFLEVCV